MVHALKTVEFARLRRANSHNFSLKSSKYFILNRILKKIRIVS